MTKDISKYTKELEDTLKAASSHIRRDSAEKLRRYIGTSLYVHGLDSKSQSAIHKKGFSFQEQEPADTFMVYHHLFGQAPSLEGKNMAFLFLDRYYRQLPPALLLKHIPSWVAHVDNWAHSDSLSKFLSRLTEQPETRSHMMKQIRSWNRSGNPWERRQSLVSLFYYARSRSQHVPFDEVSKLTRRLLADPDYFVQKAVGWTLRESYNVYPEDTYSFLEMHLAELSPYAFAASTEKMEAALKEALKGKRKKAKAAKTTPVPPITVKRQS